MPHNPPLILKIVQEKPISVGIYSEYEHMAVGTLPIYLSNPNDLVTLPDVYFRVRNLVQQGAGTSEISQAVSFDPALTVRFLSIANSALFSPSTEISSVSRAVTLLGTQIVHDIVLASSVSDLFDGIPSDIVDVKSFWIQSVTCGVLAKAIADHLDILDSGHVFVQGLLADIGHVLMYQHETEKIGKILELAKALGEKPHKIELQELGYNYCDIGGFIAEHWDLPVGIPETILHHQEPAAAKTHQLETSIVHIAKRLSEFRYSNVAEPDFDETALSTIALSKDDVLALYEELTGSIDTAVSSFGGVRKAA